MYTFPLNVPHTKSMLKVLLSERDIRLKRRWGQNFLIDQNILQYIVKSSELSSDDIVLEIGAGTGSLTRMLAERSQHVFAVEIDRKLFEVLSETLQDFTNVTLINGDILKSKHHIHPEIVEQIREYIQSHSQGFARPHFKVVANLPYYISTPVIIDLLQGELPISSMILTLQKDITNRLVARPATKDFGRLSILTKLYADVKVLKKLPPDVFWPAPHIVSAIVKMEVTANKYSAAIEDMRRFSAIVNAIYVSRRKTLLNSLLSLYLRADDAQVSGEADPVSKRKSHEDVRKMVIAALERVGIEPNRRGEELDVEKLIELSNELLPVR
ncbi:MAG: ribosomal RNA small subunit methyltransferase A [Candidatus Scalindua sp. AMX11]|nr:MAG: ribosomal RNA small subunit methyltransferase A [Candidatus Scalindua sp.]NOG83913.1 ribosomal RNA small subunit methyltransferase A [Planctomycetota bacterium]RZV87985.1 MAG: ribosomal RNA small subunit methyltransferase A [Candidatus Scalindua sp. SCAELEC01]TDE64134.1 MAG: ribosomal RNA small subunit methyltransferase A [Candidatus Scalindua sp. AMX11]GJQ58439.1 MAG: ribosomal RNA small subunit methyltransferase A [Candidatus Scalindua sp.]